MCVIALNVRPTHFSNLGNPDMKISARNALKGTIVNIDHGAVTSVVTIDIGGGSHVASSITKESAQNLNLTTGQDITAIIKASDVILAID